MPDTSPNESNIWQSILVALIRPIARMCVKRSLSLQEFSDAAKVAFIEVARQEIENAGLEVSVSRVGVMTGIYRDEVSRILKRKKSPQSQPVNMLARVITQWRTDRTFQDESGQPRVLSYRGEKSEFWQLSRTVSKNLNPSTVASEMIRAGYVEKTSAGLKLIRYMQTYISDPTDGFRLVSRGIDSLLQSAQENLLERPKISNVHIHTEYDNIVLDELPRIRRWIMDESKEFHRRVREYLSLFDRDINPELPPGPRAKVIVGGFSNTPPLPTTPDSGESSST